MAEGPKYKAAFQFKNVQLFKDQSLGIGPYGAVSKAKCDDLLCAAKIIHPTLFELTKLHQTAPQKAVVGDGLRNSHPCQPREGIQLHCALELC